MRGFCLSFDPVGFGDGVFEVKGEVERLEVGVGKEGGIDVVEGGDEGLLNAGMVFLSQGEEEIFAQMGALAAAVAGVGLAQFTDGEEAFDRVGVTEGPDEAIVAVVEVVAVLVEKLGD